jgi:hypothetical protein
MAGNSLFLFIPPLFWLDNCNLPAGFERMILEPVHQPNYPGCSVPALWRLKIDSDRHAFVAGDFASQGKSSIESLERGHLPKARASERRCGLVLA